MLTIYFQRGATQLEGVGHTSKKEKRLLVARMLRVNNIDVILGYIQHGSESPTHAISQLYKQKDYTLPNDTSLEHWGKLLSWWNTQNAKPSPFWLHEPVMRSALHHDNPDMLQWVTTSSYMKTHEHDMEQRFLDTLELANELHKPNIMARCCDILIKEFEASPNDLKTFDPDAFALWERYVLLQNTNNPKPAKPKVM